MAAKKAIRTKAKRKVTTKPKPKSRATTKSKPKSRATTKSKPKSRATTTTKRKVVTKAKRKVVTKAKVGAESLELRASFAASPERVLAAWLDSEKHSAFTGSDATIEPRVGTKHSAWNGYIEGEILEIQPGKRLVMSWRTTEFPADHPDSIVIVEAEAQGSGTEIRLVHTELPPGGAEKYGKGWTDFYFVPMATYFRSAGA
jgi:activator of HSP90 ATPase